MKQEKPTNPLSALTTEQKSTLLAVLLAKTGEKPVSREVYLELKPYLDTRQGGVNREAFGLIKDDRAIVEAAQKHRLQHAADVKAYKAEALTHRETILKALKAKLGEKPLTNEEFLSVAEFLDRKKGGLMRDAHAAFKDDKEIIDTAVAHREAWNAKTQKRGAAKESPSPAKSNEPPNVLNQFMDANAPGFDSQAIQQSQEVEPGA